MDIILKKDVANLGHADDVVKVKTGYAMNYLIPQQPRSTSLPLKSALRSARTARSTAQLPQLSSQRLS